MFIVIPAKETTQQVSIRLQIEAIKQEYEKRIEHLANLYADLQYPPSYMVEVGRLYNFVGEKNEKK